MNELWSHFSSSTTLFLITEEALTVLGGLPHTRVIDKFLSA